MNKNLLWVRAVEYVCRDFKESSAIYEIIFEVILKGEREYAIIDSSY
jgi:hypothetical protein